MTNLRAHDGKARRSRRWLSFGLRGLIIAFVILQIPFAYGYYVVRRANRERDAIAALRLGIGNDGNDYSRSQPVYDEYFFREQHPDPALQQFARRQSLEPYLYPVSGVVFRRRSLDAQQLSRLAAFPHLKFCGFSEVTFTEAGGIPSESLPELISIATSHCDLSEEMTRSFGSLPSLAIVSIQFSSLSSRDLANLMAAPRLKHLRLLQTTVDDGDWSALSRSKSLAYLHVTSCKELDNLLEHLPASVTIVEAPASEVASPPLRITKIYIGVRHLSLSASKITWEDIWHLLPHFPNLQRLRVRHCPIGAEHAAAIKKRHPQLTIEGMEGA
jgi:hypothetical protein